LGDVDEEVEVLVDAINKISTALDCIIDELRNINTNLLETNRAIWRSSK